MSYCNNLLLERGCYDSFRRIMGVLNKSSAERLSLLECGGLLYILCAKMTSVVKYRESSITINENGKWKDT